MKEQTIDTGDEASLFMGNMEGSSFTEDSPEFILDYGAQRARL
jgi:hypothetical protein